MAPFLFWMLFCRFAWYGAAGQLYSCGCASSKRSKIMSCAMPWWFKVAQIGLKAEESRRLHVVLYWRVCSMLYALSTTHRKGLLRVGSLPCAPTYNRGVVQHAVFDRFGLAQPHEYSSRAATCHANNTEQAASLITENVTAVRCTLQKLQICSRDTIASSSSSNPTTSAN